MLYGSMFENSADALRNPRGCMGQFSASTRRGENFSFMPSSVQLFTYGIGDWLPPEAGFFTPSAKERGEFEAAFSKIGKKSSLDEINAEIDRIRSEFMLVAPYYEIKIERLTETIDSVFRARAVPRSKYIASPAESDLKSGGDLCEEGCSFLASGLAARIGRVRDRDTFRPFLDRYDLRIREALASAISIQVEFGHMGSRYHLGSMLTWPLLNSVFGPAVDLEGKKLEPGASPSYKLEDQSKAFMPFTTNAFSSSESSRKLSIRLSIEKELQFENDPSVPMEAGTLVVPIQVWLFGQVMVLPKWDYPCTLPR